MNLIINLKKTEFMSCFFEIFLIVQIHSNTTATSLSPPLYYSESNLIAINYEHLDV